MSSPQNREEALFALALEQPADKRAAFLDVVCAADPALRQRLEALLAAHDAPDELLPKPASVATIKLDFPNAPDEAIGERIGRYKLLQKIGEGGCGAVYMAEQEQPVRRRVAVKVIKLGMDTKTVIARFEAERQALALMDHPNIAKVLDAGATDAGRPYFVMELVRGVKITDYCDQNKLATRERLDLFIKICQAIQHAHQKGIIHRDIKPSNILVTMHDGVPVPKVIDFGIAKATTDQRLTDKTLFTAYEQFIGTPAYMSPEQAEMSGLDIDTRSDLYSLGVLLYELLTGRTPFDPTELMESGIDAMRKTIREKEPVRPSTKVATLQGEDLSTTAARHAVEAPKLVSLLRGDIDWIVMKCLEKDRTRRYETANGVALDLQRHLSNEPVLARPPSVAYRLQKMIRRNKLAVAAGLAIAVVLLGGIVVSTWQALRATSAKVEALAARKQALDAQVAEKRLREQAQSRELEARRRAYASDLLTAKQAYDDNNLGNAVDLLNRQISAPGQKDLRGWEWRYLWQKTRGDQLFTLCRKSSQINSLAVSKDGNWLGIGTYHFNGVSVWDLRTRQEIQSSIEESARVQMEFSPTSPVLAYSIPIGPHQSKLHFWDAARREMLAGIPVDGFCFGLTFSDDGRYMTAAWGLEDGPDSISVWQISDRSKINSFPVVLRLMGVGTGFATSADLRYAAYQDHDRKLYLMDLHNGAKHWSVDAGGEYITALAFSPDGKILASGTGFNKSPVRLLNVADGAALGEMEGHDSWVSSLVFWPDGKKLASSSADQTVKIWDVATRKCLDTLRGHRAEVWRLALLPDGKTLISGAKDGSVCFWDASVSHATSSSESTVTNVAVWAFAQDNQSLVTLDMNGEVARRRGSDYAQKEVLFETGASNLNAQMSQDGNWLVDNRDDKTRVWDVARHTLSQIWTNAAVLGISRNGNRILSYSRSPFVFREFDASTRAEIQSWRPPDELNTIVYSPDGSACAFVGFEYGEVAVRNLKTQTSLDLKLDLVEASDGAFSPDGKLCVFTSDLGYAKVFDTTAWRLVATLGGFANGAHAAAFSLDGKRLAITSVGRQAVRIWETEGWQNVMDLEYHGSGLTKIAFSADGDTLGASSSSGDFHVWHAPSWEEITSAETKEKSEAQLP